MTTIPPKLDATPAALCSVSFSSDVLKEVVD